MRLDIRRVARHRAPARTATVMPRPAPEPAPAAAAVAGYLGELTARLVASLGDRLVGTWLVGSNALGDFDARRSDIDVQAVCSTRPGRAELERLAAVLWHDALPCPGRGLEFVLYAQADLTDPRGPAFLLNLNTGRALDPRADPAARGPTPDDVTALRGIVEAVLR